MAVSSRRFVPIIAVTCAIALGVGAALTWGADPPSNNLPGVAGTVRDSQGTALAGVEVSLLEWSEGSDEAPGLELLDSTESAADGTFAFTEVAEGSYVVEYAAPEVTWADLYYPSASSPFDAEDVVYSGGRLTLKAVSYARRG